MWLTLYVIYVIFQIVYVITPLFSSNPRNIENSFQDQQGISILVPAYNEDRIIVDCISALLDLHYSNYEVLVINDGSEDQTLARLYHFLQLQPTRRACSGTLPHAPVKHFYQSSTYPYIYVVDKQNGGKADALNAGINLASKEIIVTLDADSMLEPDALEHINSCFSRPSVIAAGGMVHIIQGKAAGGRHRLSFSLPSLIRFQILQYLINFYLYKITQARIQALTVVAGAFGVFRKSVLLAVGGYRNTIGEDMDITLKLHHYVFTNRGRQRLEFIPQAVCYTECPATFEDLWKQRIRWQKGFLDCVVTFAASTLTDLNLRLALYLLLDAFTLGTLTSFSTLVFLTLMAITQSGIRQGLILFAISYTIGLIQTVVALILANRHGYSYQPKDYLAIVWFAVREIVTYRLLGLIFNTAGTILYLIDNRQWGKATRVGGYRRN